MILFLTPWAQKIILEFNDMPNSLCYANSFIGKLISIFSLHHFQQANLGDVIALNSIFKIGNTINSDTYNLHNFIKENNEK